MRDCRGIWLPGVICCAGRPAGLTSFTRNYSSLAEIDIGRKITCDLFLVPIGSYVVGGVIFGSAGVVLWDFGEVV